MAAIQQTSVDTAEIVNMEDSHSGSQTFDLSPLEARAYTECPLCKKTLDDPKILPCLHTYCKGCIDENCSLDKKEAEPFYCPQCKQHVAIPAVLQTNFFAKNMIQFVTACTRDPENPPLCTNCPEDQDVTGSQTENKNARADARCIDCGEFLCSDCLHAHKLTKLTREHKIVLLSDLKPRQLYYKFHCPTFCLYHPENKMSEQDWCKTCSVPLCVKCLSSLHSGHDFVNFLDDSDLPSCLAQDITKANACLDKADLKDQELLTSIDAIREAKEHLAMEKARVAEEISETYNTLISELKKRKETLLQDLEEFERNKIQNFKEQMNAFENERSCLRTSCDLVRRALDQGNRAEKLSVDKLFRARLEKLTDASSLPHRPDTNTVMEFDVDTPAVLKKIVEHTGKLKMGSESQIIQEPPESLFCSEDHMENDTVYQEVFGRPSGVSLPALSLKNLKRKSSAQQSSDSNVEVSSDTGNLLKKRVCHAAYSKSTTVVQSVGGQEGSEKGMFSLPIDVATGQKKQIIVADMGNNRIQVLNSSGEYEHHFGERGQDDGDFEHPSGVVMDIKAKHIIVSDTCNHRVQIFTAGGKHIKSFGTKGSGRGQFNCPVGVAMLRSFTKIVVVDKDNHRVQIFDTKGIWEREIGRCRDKSPVAGSGDGQFNLPHYVAVNRKSNIFITDRNNHRVQVFNYSGQFLYKFGSEGSEEGQLNYPTGVAVNSKGNIVVSDCMNESKRIQVFSEWGNFLYSINQSVNAPDEELFEQPGGLAVTRDDAIIVCDNRNHRLQIIADPGNSTKKSCY